jgi:hypothetical protein
MHTTYQDRSNARHVTNLIWVDETLTRMVYAPTPGPFSQWRLTVPSDLTAYRYLRRFGCTTTEARSRLSVSHGGPTLGGTVVGISTF